ncbi:MAG: ribosome biogenesis GTPase Der [Gammaproteobacteria bacterium]|nr:ribosome biogenesis GTPase Der [Gammaproteobacteria bacterium]
MLPVIALLGRPNVGKSTLFNYLTRSRDALVADVPGLTRDRQYGYGRVGPRPYLVIDTGGISGKSSGIDALMANQSLLALDEADAAVFVVDGRDELSAADEQLAAELRRSGKNVYLAVNKCEGMERAAAVSEFHGLGLGEPHAISAKHGDGIAEFLEQILAACPAEAEAPEEQPQGIRVAVIGRPNVGKSTLINRWIGEERLLAFDQPGTTRDSIAVPFERDGRQYTLIDTAGIRRRSKVQYAIEKFSVVKTLQAIDEADVAVVVLDASEGVTEQDASVLGFALERGRALVVAVNKWDGLTPDQRERTKALLDLKLNFVNFATIHFISALHGTGVGDLLQAVNSAYKAATRELATPELTKVLEKAVEAHQPPLVRGRRIKLRYAHQGGRLPPVIVIHGNQTTRVPDAYRRYLANSFRDAFRLHGTPVRIEFRTGDNPYAGRKNTLTPRQLARKKRLMRHVKSKK